MDSAYDRKFEEMKKYIPFLESMITRLENTGTGSSNPRQAQLDKIRSLRDLLLDKKKRMKMDNLLKCEQVLINLYAKVEQRDTLPGIEPASEMIPAKTNPDLNIARNKLKSITSKTIDPDTLPEIARASETEVVCTPGSKEPALFQRRPNKSSLSPTKISPKEASPQKSSKRNYTRVLKSPDRSTRLWSPSEGLSVDQHLFSRRSPTKPSRRHSPSNHKRERKKSSKQDSHSRKSKDLNITLKVPEESLNSLNTKDILSRIINCSDGDVDIATLRELRTQILGELKQTGANEDITELLLKSYKNKKKTRKNQSKTDVEEGELSDSESEAIENIYGNLVVVEKDKNKDTSSNQSTLTEQDQVSRKIQICLVVNSDKEESSPVSSKNKNSSDNQKICDITDFEMFDDNPCRPSDMPVSSTNNKVIVDKEPSTEKTISSISPVRNKATNAKDIITIEDIDSERVENVNKSYDKNIIDMNDFDLLGTSSSAIVNEVPKSAPEPVAVPFKVNFYKPISSDEVETTDSLDKEATLPKSKEPVPIDKSVDKPSGIKEPLDKSLDPQEVMKDNNLKPVEINKETTRTSAEDNIVTTRTECTSDSIPPKEEAEIPLLNEPTVQPAKKDIVSEIDILQALKNEILSDTISIPGAEVATPALHQPKITKVSNAQELPKKRISIENYKRKPVPTSKPSLFVKNRTLSKKDSMKQSLKLTEKEVERFNLISKIALGDSSDDEKDTDLKSPDDLEDLAPKSPDVELIDNSPVSPPVIIPADPVKIPVVTSKVDVDMRTLPMMSPPPKTMSPFTPSPIQAKNDAQPEIKKPITDKPEANRAALSVDPRVRKDPLLPTPPVAYPNMTPSRNATYPHMTVGPSRAPNMTPNARSFEVTPNRPFDVDDRPRKHVYAPLPGQDSVEHKPVWDASERSPRESDWEMANADREKNSGNRWDDRNSKSNFPQRNDPRSRYNDNKFDTAYNRSRNDRNSRDEHKQERPSNYYSRSECPATPTPSFGRGDGPSNSPHYFGRSECPRTPSHPFGRSEPPNQSFGISEPPHTPIHPFGRSDAPMTPSHPFGRSDAPMTPSHPFGRSEAPLTPSHPFGRHEAPMTPSHPFGRSEAPSTPSHPFGRSDYSYNTNSGPKYGKPQDPRLNRSHEHDSNNRRDVPYNDRNRYRNDPRHFSREQSVPRHDPKPYTPDQTFNRDQMSRREPSIGRTMPKENDRDRFYSRDRTQDQDRSRSYAEVGSRRNYQREPSVTRTIPDHRARASSVGRSIRRDNSNELSVESHAGRPFTIDTSVNSTFQKFLDSHRSNDNSYDDRRQRASSVGRSLTRESSVGRTVQPNFNQRDDNRDRFRRAQSVGRDFSHTSQVEKSFKDVKAEFESYRYNDRKFKNDNTQNSTPNEITNSRDPRIRRDSYDKQNTTRHLNKPHVREVNTAVKKFNYRDPRQRKEDKFNARYNRDRSDSRDKHSYGISSDSVSKSPTISSVKHYKIPKIKRAPEEKPVEPVVEVTRPKTENNKSSTKPVKESKQKNIESQVKVEKNLNTEKKIIPEKTSNKKEDTAKNNKIASESVTDNNSEKRVTRRSGRKTDTSQMKPTQSDEDEIVQTRTRKYKKLIYDSDSDENQSKTKNNSKTNSPKKTPIIKSKSIQPDKKVETTGDLNETKVPQEADKNVETEDSQEALDSSFGIDDLFPDNIITDPVLDNINALIADLDNDLATPKVGASNDLFNELNIENMLEKITTSPVKPEKNISVKDSAKTIKKDLFDTLKEGESVQNDVNELPVLDDKNDENSNQVPDAVATDFIEKQMSLINDPQCKIINQTYNKNDGEPVVSTSANITESIIEPQNIESQINLDSHSTPDSTDDAGIAMTNIPETSGADSSVEKQCEMNSDISSTHDAGEKLTKDNSDISKETASQIDTFGSLLSILQDKSKIKELLSMLGEKSSENDKIKKKLEKLSEIVSDDEDTNDNKAEKEITSNEPQSKDLSETETSKQDDQKELLSQNEAIIVKQNEIELEKPIQTVSNTLANGSLTTLAENETRDKTMACNEANLNTNELEQKELTENDNKEEKTVPSSETDSSAEINQELKNQENTEHKNTKVKITEPDDDKESESMNKTDSIKTVNKINQERKNQENTEHENTKVKITEPEDDKESESMNKTDSNKTVKKIMKKVPKRLKNSKLKKGKAGKTVKGEAKRVTRSEAAELLTKPKPKRIATRELKQLQESIKEMFMSDDILNASGIRMCRLAKMVDEKTSHKDDSPVFEPEPVVVLEKVKHIEEKEVGLEKPMRKKPGPKPKAKQVITSPKEQKDLEDDDKPLVKYKPGPKSKKAVQSEKDPYDFETDSVNDKSSGKALDNSSDSESESLASSKSFGSTEQLVELKKKPKRKRGGWKTGVIKPKNKKRKIEVKRAESPPPKLTPEPERKYSIPDFNCFTDKKYCFSKDASDYSCRLCESTHSAADIVFHYKKHHPHSEIPLSRMSPSIATEAIEQCGDVDFRAISKIPTDKYTCRFCYKEFAKKRAGLETFFWHVVSMHTGEYKQLCSECINVTRCPFNLDIPPPPKDLKGQLIGYICGKCNFTQISLENLKTHVIVRHNDKETEVYTINFAVMTKKTINSLIKRCSLESKPRSTRNTRSNHSYTEASDDRSEITESEPETTKSDKRSDVAEPDKTRNFSFKSKITFENDDNVSDIATTETSSLKVEQEDVDDEDDNPEDTSISEPFDDEPAANETDTEPAPAVEQTLNASNDIMDYPHFKINYTDAGNKEYVCCINGHDNHYKTGLLISMKKHVQLKHTEIWDGYCCICKVIVTSQGQHKFSECLMHFLDKHIDNFPVLEKVTEPIERPVTPAVVPELQERAPTPKGYINVRPLAELLVKSVEAQIAATAAAPALPVIENVVSLLPPTEESPRPSPTYPVTRKETEPPKEYKYEEAQAAVMSKKHRVVLDAMMAAEKLVEIFKCAGRFCSFTTDSPEDALMHASTHQRVGGTNALLCSYCDFDSSGNSIDLVSHVFKSHGRCQFVCSQCFYRAAASQLVGSHMLRVHESTSDRVLKSTTAPAVADSTEGNLTREAAVPLYNCKQNEQDEVCTFKTVTHNKFWEHLTTKHSGASGFNCYLCDTTCGDATGLVLHLKTHGLKLYHCTLCVFGADNEPELLAHASAKHPAKPPQAYIRTICGQSGNGSMKILPLVELKKTVLPSSEVATNRAKDNPVREAERSIELEKLIGHVLDTPEPAPEPQQELNASTPVPEVPEDSSIVDEAISNLLEDPASSAMATLVPIPPLAPLSERTPPRTPTPAPTEPILAKQLTPVLKQEPMDTIPEKNDDVICLDSDDEDSKQGIINLSDDDTVAPEPTTPSLVELLNKKPDQIHKCGKCGVVTKSSMGFKKHTLACVKPGDELKCAHCPFKAEEVSFYLNHYSVAHSNPKTRYSCGICSHTEVSMAQIKKHVKTHKITKIVITSTASQDGDITYVVSGNPDTPAKAKPVKRKASGSTAAPAAKIRRYGPSDVDKLPINPILDESVYCDICEFNTKVRLNMVRHLQLHAEQQPVPQTAPVNPVPHLETNEKHFDKMVNLASSSITTRAPEKNAKEQTPTTMISSDMASRYPKFVADRYRYTCGANGCTYISVDEGMLRCHWETLHSGTNDYHCVHCPPYQHLDKSQPLSATRIIAHLKMHDVRLYACSICPYYHYKRQILEKHLSEAHKRGTVMVVREESVPSTPPAPAPTMDLKAWQCGLCKFKSMLRPEVVEHCAKTHQSKMQYKCAYCPFRTSTPENVTKHQSTSHPNREPEIFHFYYREGSIPHGPDGTPHWQKQRQKTGADNVKAEADPPPPTTTPILPQIRSQPVPVNLNLIKQEVDPDAILESVEDLCKKFGEFCEPNGLNYKCSLCKVVVEDSKQALQSHLYEELKYRKWGCRVCSYKAFHQTGLKEHMWTEHRQNQEPIELPVDINVESWVSKLLDYQEDLIKKNREKLAQQKMQDIRPAPSTSKTVVQNNSTSKYNNQDLEKYFGPLGEPSNMQFNCPKCQFKTKDEVTMQDHMEAELTKIRWCCSNCSNNFATYHEAQFHCKSMHAGQMSRPIEAARDPTIRSAWVSAVMQAQKLSIQSKTVTATEPQNDQMECDDENSLLVIRYEEDVPTPEEEIRQRSTADSDDDSLIIDEQATKKSATNCPHCNFTTKYSKSLYAHILRHYNLKPHACPYCNYNNYKTAVVQHIAAKHYDIPARDVPKRVAIPTGPPTLLNLPKKGQFPGTRTRKPDVNLVCLICEKLLSDIDSKSHVHDNTVPIFVKRGDVVVKCSECLMLFPTVKDLQPHFTSTHPDLTMNYAYFKTDHDTRGFIFCCHCNQRFSYLIDLKSHHNLVHSALKLKYTSKPFELDESTSDSNKRKADDAPSSASPKR